LNSVFAENFKENENLLYLKLTGSYSLVIFAVVILKEGTPQNDELEALANEIGDSWKKLARRLNLELRIPDIDSQNEQPSEKAYQMLLEWKQRNSDDATYAILYKALDHDLAGRRDLAKRYCFKGWRD